jgi:hypothetical protein
MSTCTSRISAPPITKAVPNPCRSWCGATRLPTAACAILLTLYQMAVRVSCRPKRPGKTKGES